MKKPSPVPYLFLFAGFLIAFALFSFVKENLNAPLSPEDNSTLWGDWTTTMAKDSSTVYLNDGDSFELSAEVIEKTIGDETLTLLGYNGSVPGPTLHVQQGSTITLAFTNNTPLENTIHSHGLRLDNAFDGVPDVTQTSVQPGETFEYTLSFPDAGVYWYHPHMREDLTQEMGLYGAFVVEPTEASYWNEVNREEILFLDDYLSTKEGLLYPFYEEKITHALMGRYGNEFLINGEETYSLEVKQNEIVRFALLNVANVRPFNIAIEGLSLKLVGSDGGAYEKETWVESVVIAPSERYLFETRFTEPGTYALQHITPEETYELGSITVTEETIDENLGESFLTLRETTSIRDSIENFETYYDRAPDKTLSLQVEMGMMGSDAMSGHQGMSGMPCHQMSDGSQMGDCDETEDGLGGIEWEDDMGLMNEASTDTTVEWQIVDEVTGDINGAIDWEFNVGDYVVIEIENDADSMHPMQHPIHFHGQRFLILETEGEPNDNLVWKDTVLIPSGETVKILIEVSNPGEWMVHCHIAEHLHSGMMFGFTAHQKPLF